MAVESRPERETVPVITEEKEVGQDRNILAAIVQSSQDAIIGKDLKGTIISWNYGAEKTYGYSAREALGKPISMLVPRGRHDEVTDFFEKIRRGESIDHFETVRITKEGKSLHVSLAISPIRDKTGRIIGASTVARDVSVRRKLDEDRLRLAAIVEYSEDAILGLTLDGIVTSWNAGAEKMFGFRAKDVTGKSVRMIYPTDRPDELPEIISRIKLGHRIEHNETKRKRQDGTIFDVSLSISPIKDDVGEIIGISKIIRDISGQKQASQYARSLIEASLDPLVTISPDGKITDVNEATVQVTGVLREKLIGSDFSSYFIDPEEARLGYEQVFKEGSVRDYPLAILHVSGAITHVLYNASVYRDADGKVLGVFAAARDTTERKKAEDLLHATSAYARSLIEASLDPLVTISPEGKITDVNHATELITGVSREWLNGTDFSNYFTEPRKAREGYRKVFKEGYVKDYPLAIRHSSGRVTDVFYNATVYRDAAGKVRGVFAAARDVTETKKASQYARSLIESSLDPLVTISPDGKITDVNEATVRVTGVMRDRLIGTDFSNNFTEPEKAREGYQQVFKIGFVKDYPLTIRSTTGKLTDVLYNASVYRDDKDNVLGVFAAARDVTVRKQASVELESSNRELESFTYSVSHDLRAPLRAIDSFSKILVDEHSSKLDAEAKRLLGIIRHNTGQMGKLIDDLLTLSRLGRSEISTQMVEMSDMIKDVFRLLKPSFPGRNIEFVTHTIHDARVDPTLFRQVWQNILSNAMKFTGNRDKAKIEVSSTLDKNNVVYSIKDNGVGFNMEFAHKLFRVFERLHSADEFEGSGVGLAIVNRIVTRHGGKVWAEAKEGEGATFYVELPVSSEAQ